MFPHSRENTSKPVASVSSTYGLRYLSRFLVLIVFLLSLGAMFHWVNQSASRKKASIALQANIQNIEEDYAAVLRSFETLSDYIYDELITIPEVSLLMAEIDAAESDEVADRARKQLHDRVLELYERAKRAGVKQLHFHSRESDSILRMHRPEKYGDSLVGIRRTVETVNREMKAVSAFEDGRIFNGYRYVFPVFFEAAHVGSVEISFASSTLLDKLFGTHMGREYAFLINRELAEFTVFEEERWNYVTSVFGSEVLEESNEFGLPFASRLQEEWGSPGAAEALKNALNQATQHGDVANTIEFKHEGVYSKLSYLPVYNLANELASAVVAVEPATTLDAIRASTVRAHFVGLLVGAIILFVSSWLFYRWQKESNQSRAIAERIERIAQNLPGVIFQFRYWLETGRSCFPYASAGLKDIFEVNPEDVVESADIVWDKFHPDDRDVIRASVAESARTLEDFICEYRVVLGNGQVEWLEEHSTPMAMDDGSILWHGHIQNISARKQYEALLKEARYDAERAESAKSRFLSTMSHEIRTPMNAIIGLSDLLRETELNAEQSEFVHTIIDSGNALLNLISDILDYSRIEAERLVLSTEEFNLGELFDKVSRIGNTLAVGAGVRFVPKPIGEIPTRCMGDEGRITQILLNLISNAVKFSHEAGRVEFYLRSDNSRDGLVRLEFKVVDHGVGISEEQRESIFKPFTQVEDGSRPSVEGTGLGLAIGLRLTNLMGGELTCESEQGKGSTFTLSLELATVGDVKKSAVDTRATSKPIGEELQDEGLRILVVDDDPMNLKVAGLMLRKMGLKSETAENGQEALSACLRNDYDLVLMDLQMPLMDGHKATAAIFGQVAPERHPSIVALTANASDTQRQISFEVGMDEFLTKPLKLERLQKVVEATVEKKREAANLPS